MAQLPQGRVNGTDYQNAIRSLRYFSGRPADDLHGCPSAAKNNIEEDCDRWIAAWRQCVASNDLDETAQRNIFYDRLCSDALDVVLKYRTTTTNMEHRILVLRMRFAGLKTVSQLSHDFQSFARLPGETLTVTVSQLERLAEDYQAESTECTVATRQLMVWSVFLILVNNTRNLERIESEGYTSDRLHEAIRTSQQFYDRHNLAPWAHKKLAQERVDLKNKRSNAISYKAKCDNCQGAHRSADCLNYGDSLQNIRSNPTGARPKESKKNGKADYSGKKKKCYWCPIPTTDHESRECPVYEKIARHQQKKKKSGNPQNRGSSNRRPTRRDGNSRTVNHVGAEANAEGDTSPCNPLPQEVESGEAENY